MIHLPNIFVRKDKHKEVVDKSDEIQRFWKSKETGDTVQVTQYQRVHPDMKHRVVYLDAKLGVNLSCTLEEFKASFYPVGNVSSKF